MAKEKTENDEMKKKLEEKTIEELLISLENISKDLENSEISLEKLIEKFKEGKLIADVCNEKLDNAERKISILVSKDGEIKEEEF